MPDTEKNAAARAAMRAQIERDLAINSAVQADMERDEVISDNIVLADQARKAQVWGSANAVAKDRAERSEAAARDEARASTAGFYILLCILVVIGAGCLIWWLGRTPQTASSTTTIITPAVRNVSYTPTIAPNVKPATSSAPPPRVVVLPMQPARTPPATTTTVVIRETPSSSGQTNSAQASQSRGDVSSSQSANPNSLGNGPAPDDLSSDSNTASSSTSDNSNAQDSGNKASTSTSTSVTTSQ